MVVITTSITTNLEVESPKGRSRTARAEKGSGYRLDYGITHGSAMENGGLDVGNEVSIDSRLEALKPAPKPAGQYMAQGCTDRANRKRTRPEEN
jgi:hypothetical protein